MGDCVMKINKKGQVFGKLMALATGVVVVAVTLVVGFLILAEGSDQITSIEGYDCEVVNTSEAYRSAACNATNELRSAMLDIPGWVPLVIIASIGAILLGLVAMFQNRR